MAEGYRELLERLPCVAYLAEYGPTGRWHYVSPRIREMLGYSAEELVADPDIWWNGVHPEDQPAVARAEEQARRDRKPFEHEYRFTAKDGRTVWVRDAASPGNLNEDGEVVVEGILTDITAQKTAEGELMHRATHDELTGVLNRRSLQDELRSRTGGALIVLDIDQLKFVNDSLGHASGDLVLRAVAAALQDGLQGNEIVARLGGDEFAVHVPGAGADEAVSRAGRLLARVRTASDPPVTASAGVAAQGESAQVPDLMIAADVALYGAKRRGGDHCEVYAHEQAGQLAWIDRLQEAIDRDGLVACAQPIVELSTGDVFAHELLSRVRDGDKLVPPSAWLPTAEAFGLIRRIDRTIAEQAAALAVDAPVSVNLSGRSIGDPEITAALAAALARSGADPANVILELTETATAAAGDVLRDFHSRVERLGCRIAIDDFGTGFGSFTYLRHLAVSFIKIDRGFVSKITERSSELRLIRSMVSIAERLGAVVIAEGIEDAQTAELLRLHGIQLGQGYHFGRPEPVAQPIS